MKKILILLLAVTAILTTSAFAFYNHTANNPQLFVVSKGGHNSKDYNFTHMSFAYSTVFNIPLSEKLTNNFDEIFAWNDAVILEVMHINSEILDIDCLYNETKTQTTVTYQGTYADENGETIEYFNEKTFDFLLPATENQLVN